MIIMTGKAVLPRQRLVFFLTLCLHSTGAQSYLETVSVHLPNKDHAELYNPTFITRWKSVEDGVFSKK
jgi:hypothetical protein